MAEAFDPFGIVLSAFIARDPARMESGCATALSTSPPKSAAKLAVEAMNGAAIMDGHNLDVRISERPNKAKRPAPPGRARRAPPRPPRVESDEDQRGVEDFAPRMPRGGSRPFRSSAARCRAGPRLVAVSDRVDPYHRSAAVGIAPHHPHPGPPPRGGGSALLAPPPGWGRVRVGVTAVRCNLVKTDLVQGARARPLLAGS